MKIARVIVFSAIVAFVIVFTKAELRHLMHEGFWPGLAGVLICIGMIVVVMALNARARGNAAAKGTMAQATRALRRNSGDGPIDRLIAAYPGPITLKSSWVKWLLLMVLSLGMTAAAIFVGVIAVLSLQAGQKDAAIGIGASVFGACFFGLGIAISAHALLRGALQLDRDGFQVTLFGRTQYLWSEVSGFRPYRVRSASGVRFNAVRPRLRYVGAIRALFRYENDALTDTYGLTAEELAELLEAWQAAALVSEQDEPAPPIIPAEPIQEITPAEGPPSGSALTVEHCSLRASV
jgi:hypothetical protein